MNVRVEVQFDSPDQDAWDAIRSLARSVTNDQSSVRVSAMADAPDWLVVEFTMPTEAQYKAVEKVDRAVRLHAWERLDSIICFPKPDGQRAQTWRKPLRKRE